MIGLGQNCFRPDLFESNSVLVLDYVDSLRETSHSIPCKHSTGCALALFLLSHRIHSSRHSPSPVSIPRCCCQIPPMSTTPPLEQRYHRPHWTSSTAQTRLCMVTHSADTWRLALTSSRSPRVTSSARGLHQGLSFVCYG
jgi:hypothetical protein